jgi:NAD(P)-dependent dehydrogenase (short-subunit alcohol dehydrogenase family)
MVVPMSWDVSQLPSFEGRSALVTGANSGIGLPTALELARRGAHVRLACRNTAAGEQAADQIRAKAPGAQVTVLTLDLASLTSVAALAQAWHGPLDVLINNAGVMAPPSWKPTEDGFELQFGTNHLGHFALTGRLLPALLAAPAARVVTVSSLAHRGGGADVLFGNQQQGYRAQHAYSNSKLANLLFGLELQRRAASAGVALTSAVAHPGVSATNLFLSKEGLGANPVLRIGGRVVGPVAFQSAAAGAQPSLYAVSAAEPGSYSGPQWPGEFRGRPGPARLSQVAQDVQLAAQLWDLSEELTDVHYDWPAA